IFLGRNKCRWSWMDQVMAEMQKLGIRPIIDLVHFGLPDWLGTFQKPEWPYHIAEYGRAFAQRYPWVRFYTPVNEIYITAQFSAAFGWWNERLMRDTEFGTNTHTMGQTTLIGLSP